MKAFEPINKGYNSVFQPGKLSLGVVVPVENYSRTAVPDMKHHLHRAQLVDQLGFKGMWLRDIPFNVPSFGDAGQLFDPFTYAGYLAASTKDIAIGISSIALPLHHPAHVAKASASIDQLSDGRFILGIATGDRYDEYPAMNLEYDKRGDHFRDAFDYIRHANESFSSLSANHYGKLNGQVDVLPKPTGHKIPMLMTGYSRQSLEWNAEHADGWMYYPRNLQQQHYTIQQWREQVSQFSDFDKPFMQPLYIDLQDDDDFKPQPIHLGFRIGANHLVEYLNYLQEIGVNHLVFNLRFNTNDIDATLKKLASNVLPHFHIPKSEGAETISAKPA